MSSKEQNSRDLHYTTQKISDGKRVKYCKTKIN